MNERVAPPAIHKLLGSNNLLVVVPDGCSQRPVGQQYFLADLAIALAKALGCYAVVNSKYKKEIMDLADIQAIKARPKVCSAFLGQIKQFKDEITGNNLLPLILILQTVPANATTEAMLLFGYGQGERGKPEMPHRPTLPVSQLSRIRMAFEDQHLPTALAPTTSPWCGREWNHINQLFRQKDQLDGYFDPEVHSLLVSLREDLVQEQQTAESIAQLMAAALNPVRQAMSLVRNIELTNIDASTQEDLQFIFRLQGDEPYTDLLRESYIDELATSIDRNGLLHPLVLLKKNDGRYKILCGFRRYQALKRLNRQWVEAKIYQETDFAPEDFFNISLAENTKRRNLNPLEIGNFLESASNALGLNNTELAERFGGTLGVGKPGQTVAQSTVHKYRKVNQIRTRGESPEIISDLINEKLQFAIAAEILAPIKASQDRDSLYLNIIKPFNPTRPQLVHLLTLIGSIAPSLHEAIAEPLVQQALTKAAKTAKPATTLINLLEKRETAPATTARADFETTVKQLRRAYFGEQAKKKDFNITASTKDSDTLQVSFRLKRGDTHTTLQQLAAALNEGDLFPSKHTPD